MLCTKPITIQQRHNHLTIFHDVYIGDVKLGVITVNFLGAKKGSKPYVFAWDLKIGQYSNSFEADSIDEAKEYATEEIRIFIQQLLE